MADRIVALRATLEGDGGAGLGPAIDANARELELATARDEWTAHPIGTEHFIATVASATRAADAPDRVRALVEEPFFRWSLAGHARGVARAWLADRGRALLDADGRALTVELFATIADVNQMSAYPFLQAFGDLPKFEGKQRADLLAALKQMRRRLSPKKHESLYNQLTIMLKK